MTIFKKSYEVTNALTAQALGSGSLPVLATPALVAFMENAALNYVQSRLADGETTVGSAIAIKHLAPSHVGTTITIVITKCKQDRRRFDFELEAYDGDTLVGRGTHTRFAVNAQQFMTKK